MRNLIITISLILFVSFSWAQQTSDAKATFAVGLDFGINGNMLRGKIRQAPFTKPSAGITFDYKFTHGIAGFWASVNFQQYRYEGVSLQYLSIPTLVYLRVGKKFQYQFGVGISQNIKLGEQWDDYVYLKESYKQNSLRFGIGGVLNSSFIYNIKEDKHQLALNFFFNAVFPAQIEYPYLNGFGGYSEDYKRLVGYRLSIEYRYVLFGNKD